MGQLVAAKQTFTSEQFPDFLCDGTVHIHHNLSVNFDLCENIIIAQFSDGRVRSNCRFAYGQCKNCLVLRQNWWLRFQKRHWSNSLDAVARSNVASRTKSFHATQSTNHLLLICSKDHARTVYCPPNQMPDHF